MNINTHILIVGSGVAGIAAAVAASRQGKDVTLIDDHTYPGGAATAAEVGTICGLYETGNDKPSTMLVGGFVKEFALKTAAYSGTTPQSNRFGLHYLPYKKEALIRLMEAYISEENIRFLPDTVLVDLRQDENRLYSATIIKNGEQELTVTFDALIDCSGKAAVAHLVAHPFVENSYFQAASIHFYVKNSRVEADELSGFKLIRDLKVLIREGKLPACFQNTFIIPGSRSGNQTGFKLTVPLEVSHDAENIQQLTARAKVLVNELFVILKAHSSLFADAELDYIADDLGWRTGKRPLGKYVLTEADVISARKWKAAVAKSAWPVEDWVLHKSVDLTFVKENEYYEIPQECLMSVNYENLFFAGRMISATDRAIASARVMGVCLQTGYAAGKLASGFCFE